MIASLEATVEHRLDGGDHEIVVGRVREVETSGSDAAPLVFWVSTIIPGVTGSVQEVCSFACPSTWT